MEFECLNIAAVSPQKKMKKYIDSQIVELNNEKYLVYLKSVPVRKTKEGRKEIIRAFVKKAQ